jgi:transposase
MRGLLMPVVDVSRATYERKPVMKDCITWVGIDDAADRLDVAVFYGNECVPRHEFPVVNDAQGLGKLIRKLKSMPGKVRCVYEAGVNGYHLHRVFEKHGIACDVAAPALTPRKPGERVKTNRIDARKLAIMHRAGDLTSIAVPKEEQEAVRDLMRAREDALEDLQRTRHRLGLFLLRRGLRYRVGKPWTRGHLKWLKGLSLEDAHAQEVLEEYRLAVDEAAERLKRFDVRVEEAANEAPYKKLAELLMGLRGVKVITAMTIIAESVDLKRYLTAPSYMDAVGLVPSEFSTGDKRRRGPITKTGNAHLRRVLVESAWNYRWAPGLSQTMKSRRKNLPADVLAIVRKADQRLHKKYLALVYKGKSSKTAAVAVARELAGFIWAVGQAQAA